MTRACVPIAPGRLANLNFWISFKGDETRGGELKDVYGRSPDLTITPEHAKVVMSRMTKIRGGEYVNLGLMSTLEQGMLRSAYGRWTYPVEPQYLETVQAEMLGIQMTSPNLTNLESPSSEPAPAPRVITAAPAPVVRVREMIGAINDEQDHDEVVSESSEDTA